MFILLWIAFAITILVAVLYGTNNHRAVIFLTLVPIVWVIVLSAPHPPPNPPQSSYRLISIEKECILRYNLCDSGLIPAVMGTTCEEIRESCIQTKKTKQEMQHKEHIKKYEEQLAKSANSSIPLLFSLVFAIVWTVFAPIYAIFTGLQLVHSNNPPREQNILIRGTLGILIVWLLFKFQWLRQDSGDLRRAVESFGLHIFYEWLLRK